MLDISKAIFFTLVIIFKMLTLIDGMQISIDTLTKQILQQIYTFTTLSLCLINGTVAMHITIKS